MKPKPYFIVNPHSAGGKTAKRWPGIKACFESAIGSIDFDFTKGNIHASYLTGKALYDGYKKIIAVGGDGTLNEVLNGFYDADKKIVEDAVLGYYPSGTGQDFSQTVGIDHDSIEKHVERLLGDRHWQIDVGQVTFCKADGTVTTRKFINESSLGFAAAVAKRTSHPSKLLGAKPTYILGILRSLFFIQHHHLNIEVDGRNFHQGRSLIVTMSNGRFFGGSLMIAPHAEIDDGLLEVIAVGDMGRIEVLANIRGIYSGKHLMNPKVKYTRGKEIRINSDEEVWIEMDGEIVGMVEAIFRVLPKEIGFIL
ncbi:MAG: diacylglycerol kinase family lipid kinase [Candidatus Saganbacteria bacterium]|nr:diacylglycerol kinase family lipid kinase [Candidatus Saganbacteria bacterium]